MTPKERAAIEALVAGRDGFGLSLNQRAFLDRVSRQMDAPLRDIDRNYLGAICRKCRVEYPEERSGTARKSDISDLPSDMPNAGKPALAEAPSTQGGREPAVPAVEAVGPDVGARPAVPHTSGLPFHPLANLFPLIEGENFDELVEDVRANGIREEIVMLDGMILDGRNRYRAGQAAGLFGADIDPKTDWHFVEFSGDGIGAMFAEDEAPDPLAFVLSKNLHRRHLSESQRAMVAARLANMRQGERTDLPSIEGKSMSQGDAATMMHVGVASVERAKVIAEHGIAELVDHVESGRASVSAAAVIARLEPDEQRRIISEVAKNPDTKRAFRSVVSEVRREGLDEKKARRETRERELGARQRALPDRRYGVILADPEWEHEPWSDAGLAKAAVNHYPVSSIEEIKARPVGALAAPDCALFLWSTVPHLDQAIEVIRAWGFDYKSSAVWHKLYPGAGQGMGYWFRINHEILLLGTRGNMPAPAPGSQYGSIIAAPPGRHSEKPAEIHELIEAYFPTLPKIELNARRARPGWDAWGLEAPEVEPDADPETGEIIEAAE